MLSCDRARTPPFRAEIDGGKRLIIGDRGFGPFFAIIAISHSAISRFRLYDYMIGHGTSRAHRPPAHDFHRLAINAAAARKADRDE